MRIINLINSKILIVVILLLYSLTLSAQDSATVYSTPFVSRLKAAIKDSTIILTWKNVDDKITTNILVYKYSEAISEANFSSCELVEKLTTDKESYIYTPGVTDELFFAVIYAASDGSPIKIFIPFRNITSKAVKVEIPGSEEDLASQITNIQTQTAGDGILISFTSSKPKRETLLYRSTAPILTADDLLTATSPVILDANISSYKDYPIAGIDYYYAVLDAGLVKIGKVNLTPALNSTQKASSLPLVVSKQDASLQQTKRTLPLPMLSLNTEVDSGAVSSSAINFPEEKKVSAKTQDAVNKIISKMKLDVQVKSAVQILDIDLVENRIGEEYSLQVIVKEFSKATNYAESEKKLKNFLKIKHAVDVEARARFYIAQIYYFQEKYQESLLEFLMSSDIYYPEAGQWIDSCFMKLIY